LIENVNFYYVWDILIDYKSYWPITNKLKNFLSAIKQISRNANVIFAIVNC